MAENTKKWDETGRRYRSYIKLEKRLSENTVESYMRDYMQFAHFILRQWDVAPHKVEPQMVERYMAWLYERGREKTSQARALSGIKSFFNFLMISDKIESSPAEFVLTPKFGRQLPDVLTTAEIDRINARTEAEGGVKIDTLVAGIEGEGKRSFRIVRAKPDGKSYARDIAEKYGLTYQNIRRKLQTQK